MFSNYPNVDIAFLTELRKLFSNGETVVVRGMETKERRNVLITINRPWERLIVLPKRNDDIVAKIAETCWMLSGRDDIDWLKDYLPRALDFSDNGITWRGAYGPRLRRWNGPSDMVDQVATVAQKLRDDPLTRQAVINIWEPTIDLKPGKDIPCNNWIHFLIRGDELHMNVVQRSSDAIWGYSGIDAFSWSVLHELMALWTNTSMGVYTHFISSFHVYAKHYERAWNILDSYDHKLIYDWNLPQVRFSCLDIKTFDDDLSKLFEVEKYWRSGDFSIAPVMSDDVMKVWAAILRIFWDIKIFGDESDPFWVGKAIDALPPSDWRIAMVEWAARRLPESVAYVSLTPEEHDALVWTIPTIIPLLGK